MPKPPTLVPQEAGAALVGGSFIIDWSRPLEVAPGSQAFAARSAGSGPADLMAVLTTPGIPARANAIKALMSAPVDGVLCPLGYGLVDGPGAARNMAVICRAPAGTPVREGRPWSERALLDQVLRPAVQTLQALARLGVTHRAIRPGNLFLVGEGVVLGQAWSAPPAYHQPAGVESPTTAMCDRAGRGEGTSADDVYALGMLVVTLALGSDPFAGLSPDEITARKLDLGSFNAAVGDRRLPSAVVELARGMLADDPDHRPTLALLADPVSARARRIAARPPRRTRSGLSIGGETAWNTRLLSRLVGRFPGESAQMLRSGAITRWLRRELGDNSLASRIEDACVARSHLPVAEERSADANMVMRAAAILDPLAPLWWRGRCLWPDGFGPALAASHAAGDQWADDLIDAADHEAPLAWALCRGERHDLVALKGDLRAWRAWMGGRPDAAARGRLIYALNPLLPCRSPILGGRAVLRPAEILSVLEEAAGAPDRLSSLIDGDIAGFVEARRDERADRGIGPVSQDRSAPGPMTHLRVLARLQAQSLAQAPGDARLRAPKLAAWFVQACDPAVERFGHLPRRSRIRKELAEIAETGLLAPMLAKLDSPAEWEADASSRAVAAQRLASVREAIARLQTRRPDRLALARGEAADMAQGVAFLVGAGGLALALFL